MLRDILPQLTCVYSSKPIKLYLEKLSSDLILTDNCHLTKGKQVPLKPEVCKTNSIIAEELH